MIDSEKLYLFGLYLVVFFSILVVAYKKSEQLLEKLRFYSIGTRDEIVEKLNLMFISVQPQQVLSYMITGCTAFGGLFFILFLPKWLIGLSVGLVMGAAAWKIPLFVVRFLFKSRMEKFVLQLIDAMTLMASGMKSGLSVVQSMDLVTREMPNPIKQEFNLLLSENRLGVSLEESFNNLAKRVPMEDVEILVTAINILKETGGNLAETFDTIGTTIRERVKLEMKISAMVSRGYSQGIVILLIPIAMLVYNSVSDPDAAKLMFTHPLGLAAVAAVIILEIIAAYAIFKIVKIEV